MDQSEHLPPACGSSHSFWDDRTDRKLTNNDLANVFDSHCLYSCHTLWKEMESKTNTLIQITHRFEFHTHFAFNFL